MNKDDKYVIVGKLGAIFNIYGNFNSEMIITNYDEALNQKEILEKKYPPETFEIMTLEKYMNKKLLGITNLGLKKLHEYIYRGIKNEVSFLVYADSQTGVYPKESNCLKIESNGDITAISTKGQYQINSKHRIKKVNSNDDIFEIEDENGKEVLTIFFA